MAKKRSKALKINQKVAKRNKVKGTRIFNGKKYKLVQEVEPISSTPDMFSIKREAKSQGRYVKFIYSKKNDTGLVYFSNKKKPKKKINEAII